MCVRAAPVCRHCSGAVFLKSMVSTVFLNTLKMFIKTFPVYMKRLVLNTGSRTDAFSAWGRLCGFTFAFHMLRWACGKTTSNNSRCRKYQMPVAGNTGKATDQQKTNSHKTRKTNSSSTKDEILKTQNTSNTIHQTQQGVV